MPNTEMESYVNCPTCGEAQKVVLSLYEVPIKFIEMLDQAMGVDKTTHFEGEVKCSCGKLITTSLHITSGDAP